MFIVVKSAHIKTENCLSKFIPFYIFILFCNDLLLHLVGTILVLSDYEDVFPIAGNYEKFNGMF
jgi:hypothetical protein